MKVIDENIKNILTKLGIGAKNFGSFDGEWFGHGEILQSISPISGEVIAEIIQATPEDYDRISSKAAAAFEMWRMYPAPKRGEIVRQLGHELRSMKQELATLITLEMGKTIAEGNGEVQEMIDICDFAVGLSRQLYGLTMHSERPLHRMYEQYHPLGIIGIISAFNFPTAVWSWNSALAAVCGDTMIWKPASKTPLTAIATTKIAQRVLERNNLPAAIMSLVIGPGRSVGEKMLRDPKIPLISATGSTPVGRRIGAIVGERLGRTILELGGNNAIIVSQHADLKLAIRAILFGAIGTSGQRCTSTRRIIAHESIYEELKNKLIDGYKQVTIGNPLDPKVLMGPLVETKAVEDMQKAIAAVKKEGGTIAYGGEVLQGEPYQAGTYVVPCIAEVQNHYHIVQEETFAPILYLIKYKDIEEAIAYQNGVPQGLSSSIFSQNLLETETFLSSKGSDCGIANVNIGTSGAEIGGAFGGEKETGGGREAGSDVWKCYMRRQTNTINWSKELPLAQGIKVGE